MKKHEKLLAAIYLDTRKAVVFRSAPDYEKGDYIIQAKIETETHSRQTEADGINHAKQSDLLKYFKQLDALLLVYDDLYIFGPGNIQEQYLNHLKETSQFSQKKLAIGRSEQLTETQMLQHVRIYYKPDHQTNVVNEHRQEK